MKKTMILTVLAGLMVASLAQAKYGSAGCGLGSMVFTDNTQVSQVLAATTNGTSASQTFGITSGTSNCTSGGTVAMNKEYPLFVEANQVALANDIARGNGETLANLSKVMGCNNQSELNAALKNNYNNIFTKENINNAKVASSITATVKANDTLAKTCKM